MMPSDIADLKERIKQAEHKATEQFYLGLKRAIGVVNRADYLTLEQKEQLIKEFNK